MAWKYTYPCREDYGSEAEYEEACRLYERAESDYIDSCEEER